MTSLKWINDSVLPNFSAFMVRLFKLFATGNLAPDVVGGWCNRRPDCLPLAIRSLTKGMCWGRNGR